MKTKPLGENLYGLIEHIHSSGKSLAYIVRAQMNPDKTTFITPPELSFQLGLIKHGKGAEIPRHMHRKIDRAIHVGAEMILVRRGCCQVDIYDTDRQHVCSRDLKTGDVLLALDGGHGFRMFEDTVLLELKQGPYGGVHEKQTF